MPFVFGFFILYGLLGTLLNRRFFLYSWVILFVLAGIVGLADFYRWEYDYGHNLDPNAPIKIPGMAYQPPLIGTKTLLNMEASSFPDVGAFIAVLSLLLGVVALILELRRVKHAKSV